MDEIMSVRKATETLNEEIQSNSQALRDEIKNNCVATSKKKFGCQNSDGKISKGVRWQIKYLCPGHRW